MSDMESILMASTVERPSATTTSTANNNNNNPNNKKPAASNVAAAASSSSATTSSIAAAAATAASTTTTTAVAGDETDQLQQKPAAAAAAAAALIPTDPKTGHTPSAAGSVIEAIDSISGQTILIRIQNIASTANLGVRLDLKKIALKCRNTEFNPRRFGAVIMRLREPRATALLFASGKICVTGVKSTHNAQLACKKFHYIIERVGFKPKEYMDFKVQNIVGTADCGFPIRLEGLVYAHSGYASYEPELFPGLIYRLVNPRVVFLIFVSGKVVITGAKKESDLSTALTKLYPVLVEFKKATVAPFPPNVAGASSAAVAAAPGGGAMVPAAVSSDLVAAGDKTKEKLMEEV